MLSKLLGLFTKGRNIAIYTAIIVSITAATTLYTHNKFIDADKLKVVEKQLNKANEAPAKLIRFNQELRKTSLEKDNCANTDIPADALSLLQR